MVARLAAFLLKLAGWEPGYTPPPGDKSVVIVYPHTSNWDFPLGILWRAMYRFPVRWAGKDTLFRGPAGALFRALGGVPINRRNPAGLVEQLVAEYRARPSFHLAITPEGTRSRTEYWKSGFYRVAMAAGVPVGLGYIDYGRKRVGITEWITLSGDEAADLERIRAYYADKRGRYPGKAGPIRFRAG